LSKYAHEFLQVARLVPTAQQVTSLKAGTPVRDALTTMRKGGFDQVPVCAGDRVIGVFSYRSLANSLAFLRRNDDPLDLPVEDAVEEAEFVRASHDVGTIVDLLEREGAVLVGEESRLDAVMTETDVMRYLWRATRPFVLLQDIELAIRSLMYQCCSRDEGVLGEVLERALSRQRLAESDGTLSLEELTLGELLGVLLHSESYGRTFSASFGRNKGLVASMLEPVREVRNKVFHFRSDVSGEELDILVAARQYLRRRVETTRAQS